MALEYAILSNTSRSISLTPLELTAPVAKQGAQGPEISVGKITIDLLLGSLESVMSL